MYNAVSGRKSEKLEAEDVMACHNGNWKLVHECVFGKTIKLPGHWEYQELIYLRVIFSN